MKTLLSFFAISFILSSCFISEELPPDQQTWGYTTPNNVNLIDSDFLDLDNRIQLGEFQRIGGMIVIKDDQLIFENYYSDTLNRQSVLPLGPSSIVFTIAGVGIAADQGLLSLTDPISDYLPEYASIFSADPLKQEVTIEQLMTHTSGFAWNETVTPLYRNLNVLQLNPANNLVQMLDADDWIEFILSMPVEASPGQRYNFNSGGGTILTKIIENASDQGFDDFLAINLFEGIDITSFEIRQDPSGNSDGGLGVSISLIDWTKFSYLVLQGGVKDGRKVLNANFIEESTSIQRPVSISFNLGYGWQLFGDSFRNAFSFDTENAFYIRGDMGQDQYIVKEKDLVISIYATNLFNGTGESFNIFREIAALTP